MSAQETLIAALKYAKEAVGLDSQENYVSALQAYEEAVKLLDSDDLVSGLNITEERAKIGEIVTISRMMIEILDIMV